MSKRTVTFDIAADGSVMPSVPLYGGVKGEHNATKVVIRLSEGLYGANDAARLSFTTGDGTILSSDLLDVTALGTHIEYELPQLLTIAAGQLCMRLVISHIVDGEETETWRSSEMVLYFEEAGVENGTPFWTGVSQMLARTATASGAAVDAQAAAESAENDARAFAEQAENAKIAAVEAESNAEQAAASAWEAVDTPGRQGASAYEIAVVEGFEGSEEEWLASLKGEKGDTGAVGKSAYQQAQEDGYTGTEEEFAAMLATNAKSNLMRYKGTLDSWSDVPDVKEIGDTYAVDIGWIRPMFITWGGANWMIYSNSPADTVTSDYQDVVTSAAIYSFVTEKLGDNLLRYRGTTYSSQLGMITDQQIGDVWFNTTDSRFYVWDGSVWKSFTACDTAVTEGGINPVTGGAVYSFVADKIALVNSYVAEKVASVYRFKGSVEYKIDLDDMALADPSQFTVGDVYNVTSTNMNYAWDGEWWDPLGSSVSVVGIVSENGKDPVTSAAIATYVKEQITAYDTDVMAVLGVDEE